MAGIQIVGPSANIQEVGAVFKGAYVMQRPPEYGAGGIYSATMRSGTMAAALTANSEIFQFRWGDSSLKCVITDVVMEGAGSIAAFAPGFTAAEVMVARAWTVDGSGGTSAVMTGNNGMLATGMGTSKIATNGSIRVASTAALTAGTKTLDAQPMGAVVSSVPATAGAVVFPTDHMFTALPGAYGIVLAQNEGIIVRATVPATGTWTFAITVHWMEVAAV